MEAFSLTEHSNKCRTHKGSEACPQEDSDFSELQGNPKNGSTNSENTGGKHQPGGENWVQ